MMLKEVEPAATPPVTLDEFKAHLRLGQGFADDGSEDTLLEAYLGNAAAAIEARTGKALIRRSFTLTVAAWNREGRLVLPIGPVSAVDAIGFVGPGATAALAPGAWALAPGTGRQLLSGAGGGALPAIPDGYAAELRFEAGFGMTGAEVPGELRQAVLLLAAHFYEERSAAAQPIPAAVQTLIGTQRPVRL